MIGPLHLDIITHIMCPVLDVHPNMRNIITLVQGFLVFVLIIWLIVIKVARIVSHCQLRYLLVDHLAALCTLSCPAF